MENETCSRNYSNESTLYWDICAVWGTKLNLSMNILGLEAIVDSDDHIYGDSAVLSCEHVRMASTQHIEKEASLPKLRLCGKGSRICKRVI